jgi:predicted AlkP superfamily phosphohydrolase/phosphomutase
VGIDAAEPTLVRELIDRGELPTLAGLIDRGRWALVDSRGDIGSGAVWPTFFTGTQPNEHEMYSGWVWRPGRMQCTAPDEGGRLTPFWKRLVDRGDSVGMLDVPWAPMVGVTRGFEVSEWGPHDLVDAKTRSAPARATRTVARSPRHPFYGVPTGPGAADDRKSKQRLSSACVEGARLRGSLAAELISEIRPALGIVVFAEVHHTTHQLWHMVAPQDPLYADIDLGDQWELEPNLVDVYREVDRQIGRILDAAGDETAVMAFSLHGMKPGLGVPLIQDTLLEALGFSARSSWRGLTWRGRGAAMFNAAKRRAPERLRSLYNSWTSPGTRRLVAQPTIVPPHDWSRTRAFSLPTDQRGFIRVNLAGREAKGFVPERDYLAMCDEVEAAVRAARSADGEPLVRSVLRPAEESGAPPEQLPDLVVEWDDAAFASPLTVVAGSTAFEAHSIRPDMTGQHAPHGFCILDERLADGSVGEVVAGTDLHRLLLSALDPSPTDARA